MKIEIVELNSGHLDKLLGESPNTWEIQQLRLAYFSLGSVANCLLADGSPVYAGGIVNMQWNRGEAWMLPTKFFKTNLKSCLLPIRDMLPRMAFVGKFVRVQATCVEGTSAILLVHLGFRYEGTMKKFGPNGETCSMYARIFDRMPSLTVQIGARQDQMEAVAL